MREDQILPHLAAIAILLASRISELGRTNPGPGQVTGPDGTADLIDQLRVGGIVLTYHPDDRTLRASDQDAPVIIGEDTDTRPRRKEGRQGRRRHRAPAAAGG